MITKEYKVICPDCNKVLQEREEYNMPWGEDDIEYHDCPECKTHFRLIAKYKFLGWETEEY